MRYDPTTGRMNFSLALQCALAGDKVRRESWPDKQELGLTSMEVDKGPMDFLCMYMYGLRQYWQPTQDDLLATDWKMSI